MTILLTGKETVLVRVHSECLTGDALGSLRCDCGEQLALALTKIEAQGECKAAIKLSDRHFGIGGDGIIIIKKGIKADFEMVMYNADGSRSQMCGNGIRCVGKLVYDAGYTKGHEFTVESMGAVKLLTVVEGERGDKQTKLSVDMGKPILEAEKIPVAVVECSRSECIETTGDSEVVSIRPSVYSTTVISYPLTIGGIKYQTTCVSMGNPHAVVFIDKKPADFPVCEIGPLFENNAFFPERTNTEFAYVEDRRTELGAQWVTTAGQWGVENRAYPCRHDCQDRRRQMLRSRCWCRCRVYG